MRHVDLVKIVLPLPLINPITSCKISIVEAECIIDVTAITVKYLLPEQADLFDSKTNQVFHTCWVPIMKNGWLRGYMPFPM